MKLLASSNHTGLKQTNCVLRLEFVPLRMEHEYIRDRHLENSASWNWELRIDDGFFEKGVSRKKSSVKNSD